ncbi:tryptophan 2,3-dioxygenase [Aureimonas glaciei]|uniref:Tryptophan 2,3-dioxygenase n=1 Tax=Aureimonas glaciei TaxID=1776957 RepID=A0A917DAI7_9HYPH|nr:tryptophan 2,3-dioxygenase [Aureimonas glaciei]GGD22905.1 tryptophan 2,3-dioxygenase [Aureimonas glaciei]
MNETHKGSGPASLAAGVAERDGAHLSLAGEMSYGDYLSLDQLLTAQHPVSDHHDEPLFIIQHQTTELWLKLILHELKGAREAIDADRLGQAEKRMSRVARIFLQLIQAWDVLATLTPAEYMEFRHLLGKSSGFQSHQYRAVEFILGNKNEAMLLPHAHRPDLHAILDGLLREPSLYDAVQRLLARRGFAVAPAHLGRDLTKPYAADASVEDAWLAVYRDVDTHWELYHLAEKLVDFEQAFRNWRFAHMTTVARIIGFRRGTGGTSGVNYLESMLKVRLFPELWDVRTRI